MTAPTGTVALLFTDIEGSTRIARELGPRWADVLAAHHELIGGAIAEHDGFVDAREGDAFFATFTDPRAAAGAAVAAQRALRARAWPTPDGALRVRMGLHVGHVEWRPTGYVGIEVHRAARVAAALATLGHNATVANRMGDSLRRFRAAAELAGATTPLAFYVRFGLMYAESIADEPGRRERGEEWVAAARATAPAQVLSAMLVQRAQTLLSDGDPAGASRDLDEAAALAERSGAVSAWFLDTVRADVDLVSGRYEAAAEGYLRSGQAAAARGDALQLSFDLHGIAAALAAAGRHEDALESSGSASAHDEHFGRGGDAIAGDPIFLPPVAAAREALGPEHADAAQQRGRAIPEPQRLEHARAIMDRS